MIEVDELRRRIHYDPQTGLMVWKIKVAVRSNAGDLALNYVNKRGYKTGSIMNKNYQAHRVAWAIYYGNWPEGEIDHINGDPSDNRIDNLRLATRAENCRNTKIHSNNSCGLKGVYWHKVSLAWHATIYANERIYLGSFSTKEEAHEAYCKASEKYHGQFGRND